MVVELEAFNELVDLYKHNILSESQMDKDDVFDEEYKQDPVFELTTEDRVAFTTAYEERVSDFKQSVAEHRHLLSEKQRLADMETPSVEINEVSEALYQNEETIEGFIKELVSYRDVLGYDAEREQQVFGIDEDWCFDNAPLSHESISTFVFADLYIPPEAINLDEQWESGSANVPAITTESVRQISTFETLAMTMFDALDESKNYSSDRDDINNQWKSASLAIARDNLEEQRDLQLALDCREILQAQGLDLGTEVIFERPDGNGMYRFSLEKESDMMTLEAKDRPAIPILIEAQGKIIESQVTDRDASQIGKAASMLNIERAKSTELTR
jgi:hypothetical protein